jgi:hypothetical protein
MRRNLAGWDRLLRIAGGCALLGATFFGPQVYFGWIGLGPLLTGLAGYDPLYELLDVATYRKPKAG